MKRRILSLIMAVLIVVSSAALFSGCSKESSREYPVTVGDVTVNAEPKNIVVLNDDFADIISYIGYDVKMVGKSVSCDQEYLKVVPTIGTSDNPDVNNIISNQADLVIADASLSEYSRNALNEAGITVVTFPAIHTFEEMQTVYCDLGAVLGGSVTGREKGQDGYDDMLKTLSSFKKTVNGVLKTVAYLYLDENDTLCTFPKDSMEAQILGYTGALNIFSNQEGYEVDESQLKLGTPTYIFYDSENVLGYLDDDEALSTLSALTSGRTYRLPLVSFSRHGTTLIDTVYMMINIMFVQSETQPATPDEAATENVGAIVAASNNSQPATEEAESDDEDSEENNYDENAYTDYGY